MKTIKQLAIIVALISFSISNATNNNLKLDKYNIVKTIIKKKKSEDYVTVSWEVRCPNGQTYRGSRRVKREHALEASNAILNAPCPE